MTSLPDDILDLLTAYALDALDPEEVARVVALLEQQPDLRTVLAELRATVNQIPYGLPEAIPPPDLRQRTLDRAVGRAQPQPAAPASRAERARGWLLGLAGLAALALILAVLGWVQLGRTRDDLARSQAENQQLLTIITQGQAIARLAGDAGGSATALRAADGSVVLTADLPPLKPGRVYQLWFIAGSNAPTSAGVFLVDQQGHGVLTLPAGQQALAANVVAVTDEPAPGSPQPTSKPLLVGQFPSS